MSIRVEVICLAADGTEQRQSVLAIERQELAMETLGLTLAEGKSLLQEVQNFVVAHQVRFSRKVFQVWDGGLRCRTRYLLTLVSPTLMPILSSSP